MWLDFSFPHPSDFAAYIDTVQFGLWRPKFIVVHNTGSPDRRTYDGYAKRAPPISDQQWMRNLAGFYRDTQKWSAGPHVVVTPNSICVLWSLNQHGTHTPSWNTISWGVETVGDFDRDAFDGSIRDNLIAALGILHAKAGLSPSPYAIGVRGLHFHKEDARTTHKDCPGLHMAKAGLVAAVDGYIRNLHAGDHPPRQAQAGLA